MRWSGRELPGCSEPIESFAALEGSGGRVYRAAVPGALRGPQPRSGQGAPRPPRRRGEELVEHPLAAELDPEVEAVEAREERAGLLEGPRAEHEAILLLRREPERPLESAERAELHRQPAVNPLRAAGAQGPALGHVEGDGAAPRRTARLVELAAAANAAAQLRAETERVEGTQLEQGAQPAIERRPGCLLQGGEREGEESAGVAARGALGREPVEELDEVAAEREAGGLPAEPRESPDQRGRIEARHGRRAMPIELHLQVVKEIERAREAAHAAAGSLRDGGESPRVR